MKSFWIISAILLASCMAKEKAVQHLKPGIWRATIEIQERELPFNFEVRMLRKKFCWTK
jgi:hypothetical protein